MEERFPRWMGTWGLSVATVGVTLGIAFWKYLTFHGAGVLPYAYVRGKPYLLFHIKKQGRKAGTMIDFGGARELADVDPISCAAREFAEETAGLFGSADVKITFTDDLDSPGIIQSEEVRVAAEEMERLLRSGESVRHVGENGYHCFICEVNFIPSEALNKTVGSVSDRPCEFLWVDIESYLEEPANYLPLFIRLDRQKQAIHGILQQLLAVGSE